jgi:uncharacterized repeat protein (TIGR01451 family)
VKGDDPESAFQSFDVCAGGAAPTAGGCVRVERFEAMGATIPDGDSTTPVARVRFTGVTGHFSIFALVLVTHPDRTTPVISNVPGNISVTATSPAGANVTYASPTAIDDRDGIVAVTCVPASASLFALGATTVTCTASDAAGNTSHASFTITVTQPSVAPVNSIPGPQGTAVNLPLLFSNVSGNAISVSSSAAALRVTLRSTNGTLTLGGRSGLTFVNGNGIGDTAMTFTGPLAKVNAALDGMIFAPRLGFSGAASLTIESVDQSGGGTDIDTVPITVGARADLAVSMTDSPDPVTVGANLIYAIEVANNGPFSATTVTLVDVLPAGVTFVSATSSQGRCTYQSGLRTVRCDIGALATHTAASATIVVRPLKPMTLTNDVLVGANQADLSLSNNKATAQSIVK